MSNEVQHYTYTIVPFGGTGVGKSTVCNILLDGEDVGTFKTSEITDGGETKFVTSGVGWALGDRNFRRRVQVFDVPGLADPDLPIEQWVQEIWDTIPSSQNIDMALMVIKANDYRMSIEQIITAKAMKKFVDHLQPTCTFICFTHCDTEEPKEKYVREKLASI